MKKNFFLVFLLIPYCLSAQLRINEIMTNNVSAVMDNTKNYSMWVELYNPTAASVNQYGYYFTDNKSEPKKWRPINKAIPAGGYNVLWFERDEYTGHASFKLEPDGGKLFLMNTAGVVVDSVKYPAQYRNISYGRKTDGDAEWVFFEDFSSGTSNNGKLWSNERCAKPVFRLPGGFYDNTQYLTFEEPTPGDTIYYTQNGAEPTRAASRYISGTNLIMNATKVIRAKTFSKDKLSSDIVTKTYLIKSRDFNLPVVSIVTTQANLTDNTIGIYTAGNSGKANWDQDWQRPANIEFIDTTNQTCVNQEVDISITGAYSRTFSQKPLRVEPAKKFGDAQFRYDFFKASKPGMKYKGVKLRNSGNDYFLSMMRDAFNHSLVMHRMDVDVQAYEPVVQYLNGQYWGLINLREVSSKDYMYSNFGLEKEDVIEIGIDRNDGEWFHTDPSYIPLSTYITNNDITQKPVYDSICRMVDVDEFINYHIAQIAIGNWDWPWNNVKIWKKKTGGKWRWIMYDTDWTFNYSDNNNQNYNTLQYVLGENPAEKPDDWSNLLMRRLILNQEFRTKFVDRFCVHVSTTFATKRVDAVMDSLANKIMNEIVYHKLKWGNSQRTLPEDLIRMKAYSAARPANLMSFLSNRFADSASVQNVHLFSNISGVTYTMNNEFVMDPEVNLKYFNGKQMTFKTNPMFGYNFKHWEVSGKQKVELIALGDTWKYSDEAAVPAVNWKESTYSDAAWKSGKALFGWGETGLVTTINYGTDANNKYPTAYFRKTIQINKLAEKDSFALRLLVDDGAVVYINGTELARFNMPLGVVNFNTLSLTNLPDAQYSSYLVPANLLKEGENVVAVEVHQVNVTTSDMIFDLQMSCNSAAQSGIVTDPTYTLTLGSDLELKAVFEEAEPVEDNKPKIVINELVSSNDLVRDEFGQKDDYIEVYNTGDKEVNMAGLFVSDTPVNPTLVEIPATDAGKTTIPPHGRLILWADNDPEQGILHMGFKLGKEGETVLLSWRNSLGQLETVDLVSYPYMEANVSYSRRPDGSDFWTLQDPTFNLTNDNANALENQVKPGIDLFPTLVSDFFTVRNAEGMVLTLTDLTGKMVYRTTCSYQETVQTSELRPGMYLVSVGSHRYKIIKK